MKKPDNMAFYQNTQLTNIADFDVDNVVFDKPQTGNIPGSSLTFKRVNIGYRNPDGSIGELIIPTESLFSFGVSDNISPDGKQNGYVMPLVLWSRNGCTPEEKSFTDEFENIVNKCKDWAVANKELIGKYKLNHSQLEDLNPIWWKGKNRGEPMSTSSPSLYIRLMENKKDNKITSLFYTPNGQSVDPLEIKGKYCNVRAAIKFESIFVGNKVSIQVKLYEAEVTLQNTGVKRLLTRPAQVIEAKEETPVDEAAVETLSSNVDQIELTDDEGVGEDTLDDEGQTSATPPLTPEPAQAKPAAAAKKTTKRKL